MGYGFNGKSGIFFLKFRYVCKIHNFIQNYTIYFFLIDKLFNKKLKNIRIFEAKLDNDCKKNTFLKGWKWGRDWIIFIKNNYLTGIRCSILRLIENELWEWGDLAKCSNREFKWRPIFVWISVLYIQNSFYKFYRKKRISMRFNQVKMNI